MNGAYPLCKTRQVLLFLVFLYSLNLYSVSLSFRTVLILHYPNTIQPHDKPPHETHSENMHGSNTPKF